MKRRAHFGQWTLIAAATILVLVDTGCGQVALDATDSHESRTFPLGIGTFEEVTSFGTNPGGLGMYRYIPPDAPENAPMVLALHACTQTASNYRKAGWEVLADEYGFYVLYPEQQTANNAMRCFNWAGEYGDPTNLTRGEGENQSIIDMIDQMVAEYSIDTSRIFISGHSGGGAQVALMLATWPDVFTAGAMIAGIPYNCTTVYAEVYSCLQPGKDLSPEVWGERVREAYPDHAGSYPSVSLWHGTSDTVVNPQNTVELLEQWSNVHGIDLTADVEDEVDGYPHREYHNGGGQTLVEVYDITRAGHGTFLDPDAGCGELGSYLLDADICSSYHIADFFGIIDGEEPPPDPEAETEADAGPDGGQPTEDLGGVDAGPDVSVDAGSESETSGETGPDQNQGSDCNCDCSTSSSEECELCGRTCQTVRGVSGVGGAALILVLAAVTCLRRRAERERAELAGSKADKKPSEHLQ